VTNKLAQVLKNFQHRRIPGRHGLYERIVTRLSHDGNERLQMAAVA
jgi:hypothetical protein